MSVARSRQRRARPADSPTPALRRKFDDARAVRDHELGLLGEEMTRRRREIAIEHESRRRVIWQTWERLRDRLGGS